ncbi:hypothetical protein ACFL6I_27635 [candidate division KSB1 bacterium]
MKRFFLKILFFASFCLLLHASIVFILPPDYVTHRVIENIRAENKILFLSTFYPNQSITMNEIGDLAHHTQDQIWRKDILWVTDKYGFRNKRFLKNPDITFIGGSFVFGGALDQNEMLSFKTEEYSNMSSYNLAPSNFNGFLSHLSNGIIDKPKCLVYASIERNIHHFPEISNKKSRFNKIKYNSLLLKIFTPFDKIHKSNYHKYIISRVSGLQGFGIKSPKSDMYFFQGKKVLEFNDINIVAKHADIIQSYSMFCDSLGIQFIFVPIPNKETIYFDLIPLNNQPNYLVLLFKELQKRGVLTIDVLSLFNQEKNEKLLYHKDDTHWNSNGVDIVAKEITRLITNI